MIREAIREATLEILSTITAPGILQVDGVLSMHLQNTGTATATIDGGLTIAPSSTMVVASPLPNVVVSSRHRVTFGAGTASLQVAVLRIKGTPFSNYEHQQQQ